MRGRSRHQPRGHPFHNPTLSWPEELGHPGGLACRGYLSDPTHRLLFSMSIADAFSPRTPILIAATALSAAGVFVGWQYYVAWAWNSPAHVHAECMTIVQIAKEIEESRVLTEPALDNPKADFSGQVDGSPYWSAFLSWPVWFQGAVGLFTTPPAISCRDEFQSEAVPLAVGKLPADGRVELQRFYFTRPRISPNNDTVSIGVSMRCGSECGYGWQTVWQRKNGHWLMTSKNMLWIS